MEGNTMLNKIKYIIQFTVGIVFILAVLWYLSMQFASIHSKLKQVVSTDIPTIEDRLEKDSTATEMMQADVNALTGNIATWEDYKKSIREIERNIGILTKKINDEFVPERNGRKQNVEAIKRLAQKIDQLSKQYVNFLKLAKDKIVVSVPPKWVDEIPHREGTIFAIGIGPKNKKLTTAQELAGDQARSNMAMILQTKTLDAVRHTIESAGKLPPNGLRELSPGFKEEMNLAIDELLLDSQIESYWVDPNGHVFALVSLPLEKYLEGSKLGTLLETLRLTKQSITEALMDSTVYPKIAKESMEKTWDFEPTTPLDTLLKEDASGRLEERKSIQPPGYSRNIDKEVLHTFILEWKHDWESKDHENYIQRYSKDFTSRGMDWTQWSVFKKSLSERYHQISLNIIDLQITLEKSHAVVDFVQHYRSDDYSDCGMKSLLLKKEDGKWKICSEKWKPLPGNECAKALNRKM